MKCCCYTLYLNHPNAGIIEGEEGNAGRWIGLSDLDRETYFIWSDGSPVAFVHWADGEPNGFSDAEDCTVIIPAKAGKWNDEACYKTKPAVCERKGKCLIVIRFVTSL